MWTIKWPLNPVIYSTKSGYYLIDHFRSSIAKLKRANHSDRNFGITVNWISGHNNVAGNVAADIKAKKSTKNREDNSPRRCLPPFLCKGVLPSSVSVLKQAQRLNLSERWALSWQTSPHYTHSCHIDPHIIAGLFISLVKHLPKQHISLILWLHTNHISLNYHLHHIGKSPIPDCPHCKGTTETVEYFLLDCPQYVHEHFILANILKCNTTSIPYLLSNTKAINPLINFVNSSGRLKPTFGDIPLPSQKEK